MKDVTEKLKQNTQSSLREGEAKPEAFADPDFPGQV